MGAKLSPPPESSIPPLDHGSGPDASREPYWNWERREAVGDVVMRLGCAVLYLVASTLFLRIVVLSQVNFMGPPDPSNTWKWWLIFVAFLFACSVAPLVAGEPPLWLRVVGIVYAILGAGLLGLLVFVG